MANTIACSLLGYSYPSNVIMRAIARPEETNTPMDNTPVLEEDPDEVFKETLAFATRTYTSVLRREGDANTLPFLHPPRFRPPLVPPSRKLTNFHTHASNWNDNNASKQNSPPAPCTVSYRSIVLSTLYENKNSAALQFSAFEINYPRSPL